MILFPEYHFSDFPPQSSFTKDKIIELVKDYYNETDLCIAGYVEFSEEKLYSSVIIKDGSNFTNLRKKFPYQDEQEVITGDPEQCSIMDLSIGRSYFFICNDLAVELKELDLESILLKTELIMSF